MDKLKKALRKIRRLETKITVIETVELAEIKRLNKLLKEYGNHKINCQCAIQMLMAESFECTCGFREALKDK